MKKKLPHLIYEVKSLGVFSWSPGETHEAIPCTQVHLMVEMQNVDAPIVMRIKSRANADELIAALIEHRDFVWPEAK